MTATPLNIKSRFTISPSSMTLMNEARKRKANRKTQEPRNRLRNGEPADVNRTTPNDAPAETAELSNVLDACRRSGRKPYFSCSAYRPNAPPAMLETIILKANPKIPHIQTKTGEIRIDTPEPTNPTLMLVPVSP